MNKNSLSFMERIYFELGRFEYSGLPNFGPIVRYFFHLFVSFVHVLIYHIFLKRSKIVEGGALFGLFICFDFVVCTGSGVDVTLYTICVDIDVKGFVDWVIGNAQSGAPAPPELKDVVQTLPVDKITIKTSYDSKPFFYIRAYGDFSNTPIQGLSVYFMVSLTSTGSITLSIVIAPLSAVINWQKFITALKGLLLFLVF